MRDVLGMVRGQCNLIFGVSGVGKTQSCRDFVARHPDYLFASASTLLSEAKAMSAEKLRTASPKEIADNQALLVESFSRFREGKMERPVLMDAHAVIDNDDELVPIPIEIIKELQPDLLILLEAPAYEVASRRSGDKRQRPARNISWIEREIAEEHAAVTGYSTALNVEMRVGIVGNEFRLDDIL